MLLKGKTKDLEILINSRKAQKFEEMVCDENENLLSVLPQKALGNGKFEFMAKLLNHFQVGSKFPVESEEEYDEVGNVIKEKQFDCYDFIDEYLEVNNCSITDLCRKIIEEFDVKGIIEKGMGFQMSKMIKETMDEAIEQMTETKVTEKKAKAKK